MGTCCPAALLSHTSTLGVEPKHGVSFIGFSPPAVSAMTLQVQSKLLSRWAVLTPPPPWLCPTRPFPPPVPAELPGSQGVPTTFCLSLEAPTLLTPWRWPSISTERQGSHSRTPREAGVTGPKAGCWPRHAFPRGGTWSRPDDFRLSVRERCIYFLLYIKTFPEVVTESDAPGPRAVPENAFVCLDVAVSAPASTWLLDGWTVSSDSARTCIEFLSRIPGHSATLPDL